MKIFIICSKAFYGFIPPIKKELEDMGYEVILPNCYDTPDTEANMHKLGKEIHAKFKAEMYKQSEEIISKVDALLVLNFQKNNVLGYIGGATFLEMYDGFRFDKQIYLYEEIPNSILSDEIRGFSPIVINGDLSKIINNNYQKKIEY